MSEKILVGLVFVVALNVLFFTSQTSIDNIYDDGSSFWTYEGSMISKYDSGGYVLNQSTSDVLPSAGGGIGVESDGTYFTDMFSTVKNWFIDKVPGARIVLGFLFAVPNMLNMMGLPTEIVYALSFLWYSVAVVLVILFLK
jgi:hypothetical protein